MALIKCEECGKEVSDKAKTCPHCGNENDFIFCSECGKQIMRYADFCSKCGVQNFQKKTNTQVNDYNEKGSYFELGIVSIVMSILGLFSLFFSFIGFIFAAITFFGNIGKRNSAKRLGDIGMTLNIIIGVIWFMIING